VVRFVTEVSLVCQEWFLLSGGNGADQRRWASVL